MIVTMSKVASLLLYLTVYILSALFLHFATCSSKKVNRFTFVFIAILFPCIMAGVRYGVGTDYFNYSYMYQNYSELTFSEYFQLDNRVEIGLYFLAKISSLFNSPQLFFALFAFTIYAPVAKMIMERNERSNTFFLALLFLLGSFTTGMNIMRQMAAASLVFYSTKYITARKFKKFLIWVAFASIFHISAIIVLPLYFVWNRREKFSIYQFKSWMIIVLYSMVTICIPVLLQFIGGRFAVYGETQTSGRNLSIILDFIWLLIFLLLNKQITKYKSQDGLYIFMLIIGSILGITGIYNVYIKRIGIFFGYPEFILLMQLGNVFDQKSRPTFRALAMLYSVFMFILTFYILGQTGIIPYAYKI